MLSMLFALLFSCGDVKLDRKATPEAIAFNFEAPDGRTGCGLGVYLGGRSALTVPHVGLIDSSGANDNWLMRPMAYAIPWEK